MSVLSFLSALRKDAPAAADVHVSTALGNGKKPKKAKPFKAIISQDTKLPVTNATLAAQQEEGVKPGQVGKAAAPRTLRPIDDETAHSPFPYDPNALASIRPDQTPRFFGALTDPKSLETKTMSLSDLTAMQDRVDPAKVQSILESKARKLPVVVGMNGRNYIADGHHRASAAWLGGKDEMKVAFKDLEPVDQALKRGARNSKSDQALIQTVHDHACALGAVCDMGDEDGDLDRGETATKRDAAWSIPVEITKVDEDQRLVFGWASVVEKDGKVVEDLQGDRIDPGELERAVYEYVLEKREAGEMHERTTGVGKLVESVVMTAEKQAAMGLATGATPIGWWVGYKLAPSVFAKVKSGDYTMFSIGGGGVRVPVAD